MYVEMISNCLAIKCRHPECFGQIYPCEHIQLTKQETNLIFNGDINININSKDDELVEFQKIDLFENYETIFSGTDNNKFNKNIILLSLREMTNLSTKEIRNSMKKFKKLYVVVQTKVKY
jgi:hypothetical protein